MAQATAPRPRTTVRQSLSAVWRSLRSMRTALILLMLLALASIAGSLVPQVGVADARIAQMFREDHTRFVFYKAFGLFDVYGSWWFTLITALLLVSLFACLLPRTRAMLRSLAARPQPARELDSMRMYAEVKVAGEPASALDRAGRLLRRRFFRVTRSDGTGGAAPQVAADKGLAREAGSLLFHWSFFLILIGIVFGKGTGFVGYAVVTEGGTWTETHASYDTNIREGRFYNEAHTGVQLNLSEFEATYRENGQASSFTSTAELIEPNGTKAETVDIRVNHPASIDGVRFYQYAYGWAPVITVRDGDEVLFDGPVQFSQQAAPPNIDQRAMPWMGAVKLPSLRPQVGIEFVLWGDPSAPFVAARTGAPVPVLVPQDPVLTYKVFEGDLQLDRFLQRETELNTGAMVEVGGGLVPTGGTSTIEVDRKGSSANDLVVGFPRLSEYTVLQVSRDRGVGIMLVAAILILLGLLPALYTARRKIWVQAEPSEGGATLKVGGFALQRRAQFADEFDRLVGALADESLPDPADAKTRSPAP